MDEKVYRLLNLAIWMITGSISLFYLFTLIFTFDPMFVVILYITIKSADSIFYFWFTTIADYDCDRHHEEKDDHSFDR